MEQFLTIKDFPDYMIGDCGTVISTKRGKKLVMTLKETTDGYLTIGIRTNNKKYYKSVHRLVAVEFIENPQNKEQVNHKDGNRKNNSVENLEWVTLKENIQHCFHVLGRKGQHTTSIPCNLYYDSEFIMYFDDIRKASEYARTTYNVSSSSLIKYKHSKKCKLELIEGQETIM